ncbi:hypothetical protein D3C76_1724320 [compost metagenome]
MGADRFLYVDIGLQQELIVRTNPRNEMKDDEQIKLAIDMNRTLFFDPATGEQLQ